MRPDFSVPPPPIPQSLIRQPPPSLNLEYGQEPDSLDYKQLHSGNHSQQFGSNSSGSTLYSPTRPTVTPTKIDMNVGETPKNENKGKLNMDPKCFKPNSHELLWNFDQLLMDILKFS